MIIGSNLIFRENVASTNTEASLMLNQGEVAEGTVIQAGFQSAGRGQKGNRWESVKGKNLLLSIILYPWSVKPEEQFIINMALSLGVCDFTGKMTQGSSIKWPNDIYVKDDKIAGILIENSIMADRIESTIAGIGLNINQEEFPGNLRNPVSMKMITGREHDLQQCLTVLLSALDKRYRQLLYGDREEIHDEYRSRLYRFNELSAFRSGEKVFEGTITDVSVSGFITIRDKQQHEHRFSFKEVDFVTSPGSSR